MLPKASCPPIRSEIAKRQTASCTLSGLTTMTENYFFLLYWIIVLSDMTDCKKMLFNVHSLLCNTLWDVSCFRYVWQEPHRTASSKNFFLSVDYILLFSARLYDVMRTRAKRRRRYTNCSAIWCCLGYYIWWVKHRNASGLFWAKYLHNFRNYVYDDVFCARVNVSHCTCACTSFCLET